MPSGTLTGPHPRQDARPSSLSHGALSQNGPLYATIACLALRTVPGGLIPNHRASDYATTTLSGHRGRCIHTSGGHRSGPPDDLSDESLRRGTNRSGRKRRQTSRSHSDAHGICCVQQEDCPLGLPPGRRAHRPGHWRRRRLPSGCVRVDSIRSYRKTFFRSDCLKDKYEWLTLRRSFAMTQGAPRRLCISWGMHTA
ncbi:hypothetical protein GGP98_003050 [Salinibacter ruber]|nr:hypothetical protein [Salinibacter ruber]